jgi:hypothetical protein
MMGVDRIHRTALRRALLASVVLHVATAGVAVIVVRSQPTPTPVTRRIETGVDVVVRLFDAGPIVDTVGPDITVAAPARLTAPPLSEPRPAPPSELARTPRALDLPRSLSHETLAAISRSVSARRVAASSPMVPALHGARKPGRSVVYILDCSGSMGEHGKLELARSALLATLQGQSEGLLIQVIVYDGAARPLFPGTQCVPATAANIEFVAAKLGERQAVGRSNHIVALRAALQYHPDSVLLLSDTDGLNRDQLRAVLAKRQRTTSVYLARVTASMVQPPHELR